MIVLKALNSILVELSQVGKLGRLDTIICFKHSLFNLFSGIELFA